MPVVVTHTKVSTIADDPSSVSSGEIVPSDWNANHTLTGIGTMAEQNSGSVNITGGSITGVSSIYSTTIVNAVTNYPVNASDMGKLISFTSGSYIVTLSSAVTLGSGFNCWIVNNTTVSTNTVTITASGGQTIDSSSLSLVLRRGEGIQLLSNGSNWLTVSGKELRGYAENINGGLTRPVASGDGAIALGSLSDATNTKSLAMGYDANASGASAIAIGDTNTSSGSYSVVIGNNALSDKTGKYAYASGFFDTNGDAQTGVFVLRGQTSDATLKVLTTDNGSPLSTNQVILSNRSAIAFDGIVVARQQQSTGTQSAAWKIEGLVRRESSASLTSIVASTVTAISNVPAWTLALAVDTTNGGIAIRATGAAATNIRWVATVRTSEVTYA